MFVFDHGLLPRWPSPFGSCRSEIASGRSIVLLQVRYEDEDEDEGPQPDATLEQGAPLPVRLVGTFPPELASVPLEDIDPYYRNQKVSTPSPQNTDRARVLILIITAVFTSCVQNYLLVYTNKWNRARVRVTRESTHKLRLEFSNNLTNVRYCSRNKKKKPHNIII